MQPKTPKLLDDIRDSAEFIRQSSQDMTLETYRADRTQWATWSAAATWVDVGVGDFDGNGMQDLAGRAAQNGQWWASLSTGSSFITQLWTTWAI